MPSQSEKLSLLASVPLFAGLAPSELEALLGVARTVDLGAREQLFHKGDKGTQIYVVVSGRLKALTTSDDGDDVVFSILGAGEVFGEVALLGGSQHRTATVTAIDACELLVIDRRDFLEVLRSHPEVAIEMLSVLAERLTRVSELVEDTLFLSLRLRLAKKFVTFARQYGEPSAGGGVRINLKLSQEEWGDLVGVTRESVNKQLRAWSDEGLIEIDHGFVVLRRLREFERLAGLVVI
jgi:CRP-like cAMP-binding protein